MVFLEANPEHPVAAQVAAYEDALRLRDQTFQERPTL